MKFTINQNFKSSAYDKNGQKINVFCFKEKTDLNKRAL